MERRRQQGVGNLQALEEVKSCRTPNSGFGEDLGFTNFTGRPKIARNPKAPSRRAKETDSAGLRVESPVMDADADTSYDPLDIISLQESEATSYKQKNRTNTAPKLKNAPQPPPFAKLNSTQLESESSSVTNTSTKTKPTHNKTVKAIASSDSDEESTSRMSSRPKANSKESNGSSSSARESRNINPNNRGPKPAPFKGRARPQGPTPENDMPSTPVPKMPAPPPWKAGGTSKAGPKANIPEPISSHDNLSASQRVGESQIDRRSLRNVKIPKKNDKNPTITKAIAQVPRKEFPVEPKKTAAFPMAKYAKEMAAKQADDLVNSHSPRKRFKADDMERIFERAKQDELMGIDDETMRKFAPIWYPSITDILIAVDAQSLCPFCDEPFPDNPSPDLVQLLEDLKKIAVLEPRLRNPQGLTAPLMTYINLCQMHRAESTYVEHGRRNRWPSVIDWDSVRERLKSSNVVRALRSIINDPHSSDFFVTFDNNIKRDGALKAASIRAQLDTFELSHPGYYGEQGLLIFFDTLNELFPNLTAEESKPLTTRQFFMSVLVPEAAALLIEEDMDCTHEEALIILRESRQYGLAMFPDRGGFFGSGKGDHMDEAGAKQLKWRKDMVGSNHPSNQPEISQSFEFQSRFLEDETDPDILIVD
ncbi:unnamed protein product [Rhizoctonia solani]|uniref:Restriction of telomere capping protein 4 n=1 Tax=Rhizoctonia solani TaxID=456999 RepID=A0A8H3GLR9_9AGAM|nr:unnamed protein product [Rhizoctonia solani]